jgi:hypothetical protein
LRNLLPPRVRLKWWEDIESRLRFRVPPLRLGRTAVATNSMIAIIMAAMVAVSPWASWEFLFVLPIGAAFLAWLQFVAASRLPREFPVETFGGLVRAVTALNLAAEAGGSTSSQAWIAFRNLLGGVSGIAPASINRGLPLRTI